MLRAHPPNRPPSAWPQERHQVTTPKSPKNKAVTVNNTSASRIKKFGVPAGLLAGGIALGAMFAPIGLVNAQETDGDTASTDGDGRHGRHAARSGVVTDLLGLTQDELKAAFDEGKTLAEIAAEQGVSEADLVAALVEAANERIDQAVTDEKITAEEAAEKTAGLEEKITEKVNAEPGERRGGHGGRRGPGHHVGGEILEELGLDRETVQAGREAGMTMAEIAAEAGVSEADLVAVLVEAANERIDQALADGKITAEEAADKKADVEEKIAERVNAEPGERGDRRGGRPGATDQDLDA